MENMSIPAAAADVTDTATENAAVAVMRKAAVAAMTTRTAAAVIKR